MSVELLDKTRKINKLLHNNNSHKVVFNDICKVLSEILLSNILVISKKGKVLGVSICPGVDEIHELIEDKVGGYVDKMFNERLLSVLSTKENVNLATLGFAEENVKKYQAIIAPIDIAGERLGTLFMYKSDEQYDIDDIILCEYGTTVVGLEMMRSVNEENAEETRKVQIVKSAISTLSFSELEAITHIFEELDRIETDRGHYVALLPIYDDTEEILEGEDEVLPLKVIEEDGETYLTMIEDDDEFEEVYQAFEERLSDLFFDDERIDEDE